LEESQLVAGLPWSKEYDWNKANTSGLNLLRGKKAEVKTRCKKKKVSSAQSIAISRRSERKKVEGHALSWGGIGGGRFVHPPAKKGRKWGGFAKAFYGIGKSRGR